MKKRICMVLCVTLVALAVWPVRMYGQYLTAGSDPARARWRQISSDNFTVIYPRETDSLARLYLYEMEKARPLVFEPTGIYGKRIPVILHPYTTVSNGSVSWAPRRLDLFTIPSSYSYTAARNVTELVTHELRHQAQMEVYSRGLGRGLYFLFGESVQALLAGIYGTLVNMEGDAVISETEHTKGGRGRSAEFMQYYRTALINKDFRNMYRYKLGSDRYYTPDRYAFGFLMLSLYRTASFDYRFTGEFFKYRFKYWYHPEKLFNATRHFVKYGDKPALFRWGEEYLTDYWTRDMLSRGAFTPAAALPTGKVRLYSDYRCPIHISDTISPFCGQTVAVRKGMDYAAAIVALDGEEREKVLRAFNSYASDLRYDAVRGRIYWTEMEMTATQSLEDYSVLRYLDIRTGRTVDYKGNGRTRWFNPAPSESGDTVAVVENEVTGESRMVLVDAYDGRVLERIAPPLEGEFKGGAFCGGELYCPVIVDAGLGIYKYSEGAWREVLAPQTQSISDFTAASGRIFFTSDIDGVLNLYSFTPDECRPVRVVNSRYGAGDASYDAASNTLYYADYEQMGYRVKSTPADSLFSDEVDFSEPFRFCLTETLLRQKDMQSRVKDTILPDYSDTVQFPSKKYSKFGHLFRIHSWAPVYYNVDNVLAGTYDELYQMASLGAVVYSQNSLGTAVLMAGYSAHKGPNPAAEGGKQWFHSGHFKFTYKGFAPYIEAAVDFNDRLKIAVDSVDVEAEGTSLGSTATAFYVANSDPLYVRTNLRLYYPVLFSSGGWSRQLTPQFNYTFSTDMYRFGDSYEYNHSASLGVSYAQARPITVSQIYPRWGFGVSLMGAGSLSRFADFGKLGYVYGYAYLPGVIRTHGVKLSFAYQKQFFENNEQYNTGSFAPMPAGYVYDRPTADYWKATASYAFPVYLGDAALGSFLYFRRLQVIPFVEYASDRNRVGTKRDFLSYGLDLMVDFNLFTIIAPISLGVRYARTGPQQYRTRGGVVDASRNYFSLLFNVSF